MKDSKNIILKYIFLEKHDVIFTTNESYFKLSILFSKLLIIQPYLKKHVEQVEI